MHRYSSANIVCSEMRTGFPEQSLRETVSFEELIMSKDKYKKYFSGKWRLLCLLSLKYVPSQKVTQKVKTVRYLFKIKLIDGTFIHLISEFSQTIFSLWRVFKSYLKYAFGKSFQVDLFNLAIFTIIYTVKTEWIQWEKARLTLPWVYLKRLYSQLTTFIMANNNDLTTRSKHK